MTNTDSFVKPTAEVLIPPPAYEIHVKIKTPRVVEVLPADPLDWGYYVDIDVMRNLARDRRRAIA